MFQPWRAGCFETSGAFRERIGWEGRQPRSSGGRARVLDALLRRSQKRSRPSVVFTPVQTGLRRRGAPVSLGTAAPIGRRPGGRVPAGGPDSRVEYDSLVGTAEESAR